MSTPNLTLIQTDFTGGEISKKLHARVDLPTYKKSCKTMLNGLPSFHGPVSRRPGLKYVATVRNSAFAARLYKFEYSRTQSYVAVFNNSYIRFIKNGAIVEVSPGVPYEIPHPYLSDDLNELDYSQYNSDVYFTHPNHAPKVLTRISDTNWVFANVPFIYNAMTDDWYENKNIRFQIISSSVTYTTGSTFVINSPGGGGVPAAPTFTGTGYGFMTVSSKAGSPAETWTVTCRFANRTKQEWSVTGSVSGTMMATFYTGNYPKAVTFYQQRMFMAGTPNEPQTIWGSKSADFTNFTIGPNDDDGVQLELANSANDLIMHLSPAPNGILIMTYASEFIMSSTNGIFSPKTATVQLQTGHGCNLIPPIIVGKGVLFAERNGRRLRAIQYSIESSQNEALDMTLVAEHITGVNGVIDMSFAPDPDYTVWCVRHDGKMATLTYLDQKEVIAWAQHETDGWFKAVATVPENQINQTYVIVERLINGVYKKYVEAIDYVYGSMTDSSIFGTSATAKATWTGFGHLEGKEVDIVADGSKFGRRTVVGGSITLERPAKDIEVGLPYTTTVELLHPSAEINGSTTRGKTIGIRKATLILVDTVGCRVQGKDVPFATLGQMLAGPPVPFSGDKVVSLSGYATPYHLKIEQPDPMPFMLSGVVMEISVGD